MIMRIFQMITIKPKTRAKIEIKTIEEVVPYLRKFSKTWKTLTPIVSDRLQSLILSSPFFPGMSHFGLVLRKDILNMRSGTFSKEEYKDIFGWSENDINVLMNGKGAIIKQHCGFTPGQKEFWMLHHNMNVEDAIKQVSETQAKLSKRKKKTTANQPTSLAYYISRGLSQEDAVKAQSDVQKKRRNNCVEYWLNKGYTIDEAKIEISNLQKKRSQLSVEYWLHRGYTLEQAQEKSKTVQKNQLPQKFSKISVKFFKELLAVLEKENINIDDFKYGEDEHCIYISSKRRIYPDFIHMPSKKIVEFDGIYWHSIPEKRDTERDDILKSMGYKVLRVPETYNKMLWNKYIIQAAEFIKEN